MMLWLQSITDIHSRFGSGCQSFVEEADYFPNREHRCREPATADYCVGLKGHRQYFDSLAADFLPSKALLPPLHS